MIENKIFFLRNLRYLYKYIVMLLYYRVLSLRIFS